MFLREDPSKVKSGTATGAAAGDGRPNDPMIAAERVISWREKPMFAMRSVVAMAKSEGKGILPDLYHESRTH
jgi:hypothetical protein